MKSLCVLTCHFNPMGYRKPVENYWRFVDEIHAPVKTIEMTFDDQKPQIPGALHVGGTRELNLMWQKEALLNVLIDKVDEYDALAWVDADVLFMNPDWQAAALKELEMSPVCQLFSDASMLDVTNSVSRSVKSVAWFWSTRDRRWSQLDQAHPGFGWAARTEFLKRHRLYSKAITGCGDTMMLSGFMGQHVPDVLSDVGPAVCLDLAEWADSVSAEVDEHVGFVNGSVVHMYHGSLEKRRCKDRRRMLYWLDPPRDVFVNADGVMQWTKFALNNKRDLVGQVTKYFAGRDEDAVL